MGGKKKHSAGLGRAIVHKQKQAKTRQYEQTFLEGATTGTSCLEATNLEDFLATAELADRQFEAQRGRIQVVDRTVLSKKRSALAGMVQAADIIVPIPRRPGWEEEELEEVEKESFLAWRKGLATLEEDYGFVVTPFERNLDFWRQLWRVVERADLVVQILDCRDPLFYRSRDLELWVKELGKNNLVLLNKADLMDKCGGLELRRRWKRYFAGHGVEVVFFSALEELLRLGVPQPYDEDPSMSSSDDRSSSRDGGTGSGGPEQHGSIEEVRTTSPEEVLSETRTPVSKNSTSSRAVQTTKPKTGVFARMAGLMGDSSDEEEGESDENCSSSEEDAVAEGQSSEEEALVDEDLPGTEDAGAEPSSAKSTSEHEKETNEEVDHEEDHTLRILSCEELMDFLHTKLAETIGAWEEGRDAREAATGADVVGRRRDADGAARSFIRKRPAVGFVGFPNVGKSSIINALWGEKKVSMSRQPGKTKHFQTLEAEKFTLCDCPGLVFPSVVGTKAHLIINSTMPIDQCRADLLAPVELVCQKLGCAKLYKFYGIKPLPMRGNQHTRFLCSFASQRGHFLRDKVPDETWAAQRVLKDFTTGILAHCEEPPVLTNGAGTATSKKTILASSRDALVAGLEEASVVTKKETLLPVEEEEEEGDRTSSSGNMEVEAETTGGSPADEGNRVLQALDDLRDDATLDADLAEMLGFSSSTSLKRGPGGKMTKRGARRQAKLQQKCDTVNSREVEVYGIEDPVNSRETS